MFPIVTPGSTTIGNAVTGSEDNHLESIAKVSTESVEGGGVDPGDAGDGVASVTVVDTGTSGAIGTPAPSKISTWPSDISSAAAPTIDSAPLASFWTVMPLKLNGNVVCASDRLTTIAFATPEFVT